jgi:hypothetical protein
LGDLSRLLGSRSLARWLAADLLVESRDTSVTRSFDMAGVVSVTLLSRLCTRA